MVGKADYGSTTPPTFPGYTGNAIPDQQANEPLPSGTDRSGAITAGGTAQVLAPANSSRGALTGQNISAGDLWINEVGGTATVDAAGSYKIVAGQGFSVATNRAVSIVGASTGQKWTATEV